MLQGEKQSVSFAVRHADDVAAATSLKLTTCSPMVYSSNLYFKDELDFIIFFASFEI